MRAMSQDLTAYRAAAQALLDGPFAAEPLLAKVDELAAFIRAAAIADPHGPGEQAFENSLGFLKTDVTRLRARLEHLLSGEPTRPVILDLTANNDFESTDDYGLTVGTTLLSSPHSTAALAIDAATPLSGNQSLRYDFTFGNEPTTWQQWSFYSIPTAGPQDLSAYQGILFTARSNTPRVLRVDLNSPHNSATNLGVQVGWDVSITDTAQVYSVTFASARVPSWATDPQDDLAAILASVTGLSFRPQPATRDATGQIPGDGTEPGWVELDDIQPY